MTQTLAYTVIHTPEADRLENQKLLLQNYVRQRGWNEVDVYIDDGYSGTNFNRPGVRRLIEDAKAKRINVILVKDLRRDFLPGFLKDGFDSFPFEIFVKRMKLPRFI